MKFFEVKPISEKILTRRQFLKFTAASAVAITAGSVLPKLLTNASAKEEIKVGFLADLTKALGFFNSPRLLGLRYAYEYMEEKENGIAGRKPSLIWFDHKSDPTEAVSGFTLLSGKTMLNSSCGTGEQLLLKPRYEAEKFITFTCSASPGVIYPLGHVFATTPYFPNQLGCFVDWVVETWDGKGKGRGPKLVSMSYPSPYGKSHLTEESKAYMKEKKVEFLGEIDIPFVIVDATAALAKAKDMGADWVFTAAAYVTLGPLLKDNHEKGFGLKFGANSFGADPAVIPRAGAEAAEALYSACSLNFTYEDTEGMRLVRQNWEDKKVRPEDRSTAFVQAWMEALMIKAAVEETLDRVKDWKKVDPRELVLTIQSWGTRDIRGLGKVTYSRDSRDAKTARIVGVRKGQWVPLTDWRPVPNLVPKDWLKPLYT